MPDEVTGPEGHTEDQDIDLDLSFPSLDEPEPTAAELVRDAARDEMARLKDEAMSKAREELSRKAKDGLRKAKDSLGKGKDAAGKAKRAADGVGNAKRAGDAKRVADTGKAAADGARAARAAANAARAGQAAGQAAGTAASAASTAAASTAAASTTAAAAAGTTAAAGTAAAGTAAAGTAAAGTAAGGAAAGAGTTAALPVIGTVLLVLLVIAIVGTIAVAVMGQMSDDEDQTKKVQAEYVSYKNNNVKENAKGQREFFVNMPITTTVLEGHNIPMELDSDALSTGRRGVGKTGLEEHMPVPGHTFGGVAPGKGSFTGIVPYFGRQLSAAEEVWYVNMRWEYGNSQWKSGSKYSSHGTNVLWTGLKDVDNASLLWHKRRKLLVTNQTTGKMAVLIIGDYGPGISTFIGGMSPESMYYLSNQDGTKQPDGTSVKTPMGGSDHTTDYRFEWIVNADEYEPGPLVPKALGNTAGLTDVQKGVLAFCERADKRGDTYSQTRRFASNTWDCSSFAYGAYRKKATNGDGNGVADLLPDMNAFYPTAGSEHRFFNGMGLIRTGPNGLKALQPGDMLFRYDGDSRKIDGIGHVMIFIGDGKITHASGSRVGVITSNVPTTGSTRYAPGSLAALAKGK